MAAQRPAEKLKLKQLVRTFTLRTSEGFVETTGTDPSADEIIEIGMVVFEYDTATGYALRVANNPRHAVRWV